MTGPIVHRVTARNTARSSPNKMHDDDVARSYGFSGGLVPGVTIFAWMCGPALDAFGPPWLERGRIAVRFSRPVYEGDDVRVEGVVEAGGLALSVRAREEVTATGSAALDADPAPGETAAFVRVPLPADPAAASPEALSPGLALGTVDATFQAERAREYLASIGADHPVPVSAAAAHPGWLLLFANLALSNNVVLSPWIHVSSDVTLHSSATDCERVSALSRVAEEYERKGHRFVELDVAIVASDDRPVASIRHVAIYAPRPPN